MTAHRGEHAPTIAIRRGERASPKPWTPEDIARAVALKLEDGLEDYEIAEELQRPLSSVINKMNEEIQRWRRDQGQRIRGYGATVPAHVLAERDRRRDAYDERDTTGQFFNDPPKGYSALDRKRSGA